MQNFSLLKTFCLETATNCLPFFRKHPPIQYESVDNGEISNWNSVEEKRHLKNEMFNESNKAPIELNSMIQNSTDGIDVPVNRAPKTNQTSSIEKSKLIGNINEDQLPKNEGNFINDTDYFQSLNTNETSVSFNNVINSQTSKLAKANLDKGFNEKFKLEENIEPGGNWLDEQDITLDP